jgi:hypothetical protein
VPADIGPSDEVAAILADVGERHSEPATDLAIHADGELVGARRTHAGIQLQVEPGINH